MREARSQKMEDRSGILTSDFRLPASNSLKVLELFAGSCTFSRIAREMGAETFTSDIEAFPGIDYQCNIMDFNPVRIPWTPDLVWASVPCPRFSTLQASNNWTKKGRVFIPKNIQTKSSLEVVQKTLKIIRYFQISNPELMFFIENPRAILRMLPMMNSIPRKTITYCKYGANFMKPTDIFTNCISWKPKKLCVPNGSCHHERGRGISYFMCNNSKKKAAYERSKLPEQLCREILEACFVQLGKEITHSHPH